MRRTRLSAVGIGILAALSVATLGLTARREAQPIGQEVTIVFRRDAVGVGPVLHRRANPAEAADTNLTGQLLSLDDQWAVVRVGQFIGGRAQKTFDDCWIARESILMIVREVE